MSHCQEILTFDAKTDRAVIGQKCGRWADTHCDKQENPSGYDTLDICFTDYVFDNYEDACDYLSRTFGDYREIAVKYFDYPQFKVTKAMIVVDEQIEKYRNILAELDKPHYADPTLKSITVKCKYCNAVLPTKYCGKSYRNNCPICGNDLRPTSTIEKVGKYNEKLNELYKKRKQLVSAEQKKNKSKATLRWAVGCEVHC